MYEQLGQLYLEQKRFSDSDIESVKKFDSQLQLATERMDLHLSTLPLFSALERSVSKLLTLKTFNYTRENDSPPKMEITGEASVLNSLAFQRDIAKSEPLFIGATFTQVSLTSAPPKDEKSGSSDADSYETVIPFLFSNTIDVSLLQYDPPQILEDTSVAEEDGEEIEEDQTGEPEQTDN